MARVQGPYVVVHNTGHVRDCVAMSQKLGRPVTLISPPGAVASMGPEVYRQMIASAISGPLPEGITAVIDCGDTPGQALAALRAGCLAIRLDADSDVLAKLRDMAGSDGVVMDGAPLHALDLADPAIPPDALHDWLAQ